MMDHKGMANEMEGRCHASAFAMLELRPRVRGERLKLKRLHYEKKTYPLATDLIFAVLSNLVVEYLILVEKDKYPRPHKLNLYPSGAPGTISPSCILLFLPRNTTISTTSANRFHTQKPIVVYTPGV